MHPESKYVPRAAQALSPVTAMPEVSCRQPAQVCAGDGVTLSVPHNNLWTFPIHGQGETGKSWWMGFQNQTSNLKYWPLTLRE